MTLQATGPVMDLVHSLEMSAGANLLREMIGLVAECLRVSGDQAIDPGDRLRRDRGRYQGHRLLHEETDRAACAAQRRHEGDRLARQAKWI